MTFRFDGRLMTAKLIHYANGNYNSIDAIVDTGCTITHVGLKSLAVLLRTDESALVSKFTNVPTDYRAGARNATGRESSVVRATVSNVILSDGDEVLRIPELRCVVNVDDKWAEEPAVLVGLDLLFAYRRCELRNGSFIGFEFDSDKYRRNVYSVKDKSVSLYRASSINSRESSIGGLFRKATGD